MQKETYIWVTQLASLGSGVHGSSNIVLPSGLVVWASFFLKEQLLSFGYISRGKYVQIHP